ncbi:DUF1471 domain-containing protein [Pantoea sp. MBD-2R]|uniref:DUF1471 domain-containing protein n=1 Tax=Pantoea sp. MBD-2R TaxID=3141540 RepID=UPI003184678C
MNIIKKIALAALFSGVSFAGFAQTVTASADTLDGAEAKIAAQAEKAGASYQITEAFFNNHVHMTAELTK